MSLAKDLQEQQDISQGLAEILRAICDHAEKQGGIDRSHELIKTGRAILSAHAAHSLATAVLSGNAQKVTL